MEESTGEEERKRGCSWRGGEEETGREGEKETKITEEEERRREDEERKSKRRRGAGERRTGREVEERRRERDEQRRNGEMSKEIKKGGPADGRSSG